MFLDASVIVAILTEEPEADELVQIIAQNPAPITSAMAVFESTVIVARRKSIVPNLAYELVRDFLSAVGASTVSIGEVEGFVAISAFQQFGKGRKNKAQLNMGDCFAYACAMTNGSPLLFKGDDFNHTDIDIVRPR